MRLSAQTIRKLSSLDKPLVSPFRERGLAFGLSFGLGPSGYDIRLAQDVVVQPKSFALASSLERFCLPDWLAMDVKDKSTWARRGVFVQNTTGEAGWEGWLTLEISNDSGDPVHLDAGTPIAQVVFEMLDHPTEMPYRGKYQNQPDRPVGPIEEKTR